MGGIIGKIVKGVGDLFDGGGGGSHSSNDDEIIQQVAEEIGVAPLIQTEMQNALDIYGQALADGKSVAEASQLMQDHVKNLNSTIVEGIVMPAVEEVKNGGNIDAVVNAVDTVAQVTSDVGQITAYVQSALGGTKGVKPTVAPTVTPTVNSSVTPSVKNGVWFKNPAVIVTGVLAVVGVVYYFFKPKKRRR